MNIWAKAKLIILPLCLLPLTVLIYDALNGQLGADPASELTLALGKLGLQFLLLSLAITPIRKLTGLNSLIRYRRMLGLFALFYAVLHLCAYLLFILGGDGSLLLAELYKRPYIVVGALAVIILCALGFTSTKKAMKRLGKHWVKLHRMVYVAGGLAVLHYFWLVKSDYSEPLLYGVIFASLMLLRLSIISDRLRIRA